MHFTKTTDMQEYQNHHRFENQKVQGLKFQEKFCGRISVVEMAGGSICDFCKEWVKFI
jgi:hypothetical protein